MSNLKFINDALSLIGVLPEGQDASAEQGDLALRTCNELVEEWAEEPTMINVNWSTQSAINAECSLTGLDLTAVKHHLAIRLCPHFGREPSGALVAIASNAFSKLQRREQARLLAKIELVMPRPTAGWGYNVQTDDFN